MLLASSPLSPETYIGGGLVILFLLLFAETGLLIGFFLPGDTLLLLAGAYTLNDSAKNDGHHLNFGTTALVCFVGAVIGAQVGHEIGRRAGPRLFAKPSRAEQIERTRKVLHRLGEGKAVVAARFIPVVRTFMNPAVGATGMASRDFAIWNIVGAALWIPLVLFLGRLFGKAFPLDKIIIVVVVLSLALPVIEAIRRRRRATTA